MLWQRVTGVLMSFCLVGLSHCASKQQPETAEEYLQQGTQQLARKRTREARQSFRQVLEQFPDSYAKPVAQFNLADALYAEGNYLEARFEYQKFLELYPTHAHASRAQFQIGMCSLQTSNPPDRDQQATREALRAFRAFRQQYAQDPLVPEAEAHIRMLRGRLAAHEFMVARFYYRKKAHQAAINRLLNLLQLYPHMPELDEALYMLATSYRAEENYAKAQRVLRLLVDRFPQSSYLSQARTQLRTLPETGITVQPGG